MQYLINGKPVEYDGLECGIYKIPSLHARPEYAAMDIADFVNNINALRVATAIASVTAIKTMAEEQARWRTTRQNAGFPILRQIPEPSVKINEVRANIQNTARFCDLVLKALQGK